MSNVAQNRLVIVLARESLQRGGFTNVACNKDQGTFPHTYATARDAATGKEYLIGITGREERSADGGENKSFNLVRIDDDKRQARELAKSMDKELAFVAVALRKSDNSYAAYFRELEPIGFPRSIPMLQSNRSAYRPLTPYAPDMRIKDL
jgi:hypothetical protein